MPHGAGPVARPARPVVRDRQVAVCKLLLMLAVALEVGEGLQGMARSQAVAALAVAPTHLTARMAEAVPRGEGDHNTELAADAGHTVAAHARKDVSAALHMAGDMGRTVACYTDRVAAAASQAEEGPAARSPHGVVAALHTGYHGGLRCEVPQLEDSHLAHPTARVWVIWAAGV